MDKFKLGVLQGYLVELFDKTNILYNTTSEDPEKQSMIVTVHLAEIFTLRRTADLFLTMNEDLEHYEITSLFSFFDRVYFELKKVIEKKDTNTSWLYSEFENYKDQHEIVIQMLQSASGIR